MEIYEVPDTMKELFTNKEESYRIIDYTINDMDNIESLTYFLEYYYNDNDWEEVERETTYVILSHKDFNYKIQIDSGGLGDFYSHGYDVSIVEE